MNKLFLFCSLFTFIILSSGCKKDVLIDILKPKDKNTITVSGIEFDRTSGFNSDSTKMIDLRDSAIYATVKIGTQFWMAENLRFDAPGSYLYPNNPSATYGKLYNWNTVMAGASSSNNIPSGVQGICPNDWHVPSDAEWMEMESTLGMHPSHLNLNTWRGTDQGTQLKSQIDWYNNGNGTNSSGFNALPAGDYWSGNYINRATNAYFWSSTAHSTDFNWGRSLAYSYASIRRFNFHNATGGSCRCVRN